MDHPPGKLTPGGAGVAIRPRSPHPETQTDAPQRGGASGAGAPIPVPVSGLRLLGRFERSGHRDAPSLVRRPDGQVVQLTPLLYAVLESVDGHRRYDQISNLVAERTGRLIAEEDIHVLVEEKLRPLGLLQMPDGSEPLVRKANPLLALRLRAAISNERVTRRIAAPFAKLFLPPLVVVFTLAFLAVTGWLLFERGLAPAVRSAIYEPGLLLLVFGLTVLSAGFHELGHAAACLFGGGRPGAMGVGLYLVFPAFYTDVTDAYRLDRRARLRVDLGGIYFNALFAVGAFGLWAATGWEALLAIIPLQLLQMLRQLVPLVRLDGYHILADLTGVPDLFAHIKPILAGMLPTNWGRSENRSLKPWVRLVVGGWVLLVVPVLIVTLVAMVVTLPRLVATAWDSIGLQWADMTAAWAEGDRTAAAVHLLSVFAVAIPILSMCYLALRVVRRAGQRVWTSTEDHPVRRAVAIVVAACLVAALSAAWWPGDRYRPIEADERGTLAELATGPSDLLDPLLASDSVLVSPAVAPEQPAVGGEVSLEENPSADTDVGLSSEAEQAEPGSADDFRFTEPPPPGEGDNQALAINYTDGSSLIAMALSLVFANGDTIDNTNEAFAMASCTRCVAAAIAFQLVVVLEEADVIVPQNTAVAVTAYCLQCVTYALAMQIIVTVAEPLSDAAIKELDAIWVRLEELQVNAGSIPLDELTAALEQIETEILDVLTDEGALEEGTATDETESTESLDPSPTPTAEPTVEPSPTTSASPTAEPTPTAEASPTTEPSPSPTVSP